MMKKIIIFACICFAMTSCTKVKSWLVSFVSFDDDQDAVIMESVETMPAKQIIKPAKLKLIAKNLRMVTDIQPWPLDKNKIVVLEKTGRIVLLDVVDKKTRTLAKLEVRSDAEQGLLGIAFPRHFSKSGQVIVHYTPAKGKDRTRIASFQYAGNQLQEKFIILEVDQPYPNHNGGQILFGPDEHLYVALGDGGWADDPHGHGQNLQTLLGSILRVSPSQSGSKPTDNYTIPEDNPFKGKQGLPEIFNYGQRNPWKFDFDSEGRLIVADVGQNSFEEVSFAFKGGNNGWKKYEGFSCFDKPCKNIEATPPFFTYGRDLGGSITGGVYVTNKISRFFGYYLFGDFVSGNMWAVRPPKQNKKVTDKNVIFLGKSGLNISSFGRDGMGRIYLAAYARGAVYQIVD